MQLVRLARMAVLLALASSAVMAGARGAEDIAFPRDSGVIDVTRPPYSVRGDGSTDVTVPLQKALSDHANRGRILFLPAGTYLISDTLAWPPGDAPDSEASNIILQGQSVERTVLKLKDSCAGFDDASAAKAMVSTGDGPGRRIRNAVRNLSLDSGSRNPGAVGLKFSAHKQGCVRDVTIRSGDGGGLVGLDLGQSEGNGPCLVKHVRIVGFKVGIRTAGDTTSLTLESITLEGQAGSGLENDGSFLSVRGLTSQSTAPAVRNKGYAGHLALVDSALEGLGRARWRSGVINEATLFARNMASAGYRTVIDNRSGEGKLASKRNIEEFVSHPIDGLFERHSHSLSLPVKETPELPFEDHAFWASPTHFGGQPDDNEDDTQAIQAAIDSGKTTVYLPNGYYLITDTILIRKNVRRLIGCEAILGITSLVNRPAFRVVEGSSPIVVFERMQAGFSRTPTLENPSNRTLVIRDCYNICGNLTGPGEVFIEDVCSNPFTSWRFGRQNVWVRQLSVENEGTHIVNDGGALWILGLTTERGGTLIETTSGGRTEVIGGLCRSSGATRTAPMFVCRDSTMSVSIAESIVEDSPFSTLVAETRAGETKTLVRGKVPERNGGSVLPLFVGRPAADQ